jgi:hypothetical protein
MGFGYTAKIWKHSNSFRFADVACKVLGPTIFKEVRESLIRPTLFLSSADGPRSACLRSKINIQAQFYPIIALMANQHPL